MYICNIIDQENGMVRLIENLFGYSGKYNMLFKTNTLRVLKLFKALYEQVTFVNPHLV